MTFFMNIPRKIEIPQSSHQLNGFAESSSWEHSEYEKNDLTLRL